MLVGPASLVETLTCVSGYTCSLDELDIPSESLIAVRDTCGASGIPRGVPEIFSGSQISNLIALPSASSVMFATSTDVRLSAAGGLYRLCWCASRTCKADDQFAFTDFGSLQILGPSPLEQDQTCLSGRSCALEITFSGEPPGKLAILETCSVPAIVPRLSAEGLMPQALDKAGHFGIAIQLEEFHSNRISASGGQYSLCWCSLVPGPCLQASDFSVSVGMLTVIGPNTNQKTCISGQPCSLERGTLGLGSLDHLLIAHTCGDLFGGQSMESMAGSFVSGVSFGGQFRLCWCSPSSPSSSRPWTACSEARDFTDIGGMLIIGPAPLKEGKTCIGGLSCKLEGLTGDYLSDKDKMILSDTCGVAAMASPGEVKASDGGFGASVIWEPLKVAGGLYRLCWCSGNAQCIAGEDFKVDVGSLTMIGVNMQQDRTCVSGLVCRTEGITGKYLSNEDHFLILETCGVTSSYVEGFPSASSYVASSGASVSFGGQPATAAGGKYQLCWCPGLQTNSKSFFCSDLDCEE